MSDTETKLPSMTTEKMIETLEYHALFRIVELVDEGRLDEAGKIVGILKGVGIV